MRMAREEEEVLDKSQSNWRASWYDMR